MCFRPNCPSHDSLREGGRVGETEDGGRGRGVGGGGGVYSVMNCPAPITHL